MPTAVRFRFTAALCERLSFDQQIVAVDEDGKPITAPTSSDAKEWWCADELVRGLWIRVTPGATTWTIRRKLMGRTTSRAIAQVKRPGVRGDAIGLDVARERARKFLESMAQGKDPILVKADQVAATKKARAERALTMGKVYEDFCSKDSVKASTQIDRKKVIKWMSSSPLWRTPWAQVTPEVVEESMGPLRNWVQTGQRPTGLRWGPSSISPGTLHKIQAYLKAAWTRQARHTKSAASGRGEGPFALWQADGHWPEQRQRSGMLDTETNAGKAWLAALIDLQQQAHAATGKRISVRSTATKPGLGVLCDYYLLVLIWGTRLSETAQLTWSAVDWEHDLVQLAPETTKSSKEGIVPLTTWAREILMERKRLNAIWRPEETKFCFPSRQHGKPISNPRGILTTLNEAAGLDITTHDLRRTMATDLGSKADQEQAAKLLLAGAALQHAGRGGAVSTAATRRYLQRKAELLRPFYQQREARLAQVCGRPPWSSPEPQQSQGTEVDAMVAAMIANPALASQALAAFLAAKK